MINKLNKKHKIILIVIGILIITSIAIGISYAYWQLTHKQTENNELVAGCFEITFEETGSDIVLTNTFPVIDEEGLQQVPYKFKIKNTCTIDAQYNITLNSFGTTNLMADSSIKYAFGLSKKDKLTYEKKILTTASENTDTSNIDLNDLIKSYIIGSGFLRVGEEEEFSLYLWMDESVGNDQMNKTFSAKIYITNIATNKAPLLANLKATSSVAATGKFLDGPLVKNTIEKLEFVNSNKVPTDAIGSWDVSEQQNGAIMAWYYDSDANSKYEVYIGQNEGVVANPNSSYLFQNLTYLSSIDLTNLDTSNITNMSYMFYYTGYSSPVFTLDLGNQFNTSEVTTMQRMFNYTGRSSTVFTLDLGDKFDTSSVTNMSNMFDSTGYSSTVFTLNLGDKFDTTNVKSMNSMFATTGYSSPVFTLNLGDKFDTSSVTGMSNMFTNTGYNSTIFTLDLGDKFDTSNATFMYQMFFSTGNKSTIFTLSLGNLFDTSNVTNMQSMFASTGSTSKVFTLDLGDKFDTSKVTDMYQMFYQTGYSSPVFTLNFGNKFDTSKVTDMSDMFYSTGYSSPVFTLNLGDKFDTSKVTSMGSMFNSTGYSNPVFTLNLGDKFDTSNVTNMSLMFSRTGYKSTVFKLDLGGKFDTSKVTDMTSMFYYTGRSSTVFTLDLGDKFDTSKVTNMTSMFEYTGYSNPDYILDLRSFTFDQITSYNYVFAYIEITFKVYVKNTNDKYWVQGRGFGGLVFDCSIDLC